MNTHRHQQAGLSLMEVLVSSVLITMIFLWVSESHIRSLSDIAETSQRTKAVWSIEELAERIRMTPLLESYKTEINGVSNVDSYCRQSATGCQHNQCTSEEMVKFDVRRVYCGVNKNILNGFDLSLDCFDSDTGNVLSNCDSSGVIKVRITAKWSPKGRNGEKLKTYTDFLMKLEQSMYFNGQQWLDYSGFKNVLDGSNFTIALWVKPYSLQSTNRSVFGFSRPTVNDFGVEFWQVGNNLRYFYYSSGGVLQSQTINNFYSSSDWVHVAWVKKDTAFTFYKNGVLVHEQINIPGQLLVTSDTYKVGANFLGELDEIQFYNSVLTANQIRLLTDGRVSDYEERMLNLDFEGATFHEAASDKSSMSKNYSNTRGMNDTNRRHSGR